MPFTKKALDTLKRGFISSANYIHLLKPFSGSEPDLSFDELYYPGYEKRKLYWDLAATKTYYVPFPNPTSPSFLSISGLAVSDEDGNLLAWSRMMYEVAHIHTVGPIEATLTKNIHDSTQFDMGLRITECGPEQLNKELAPSYIFVNRPVDW